MEVFYQNGASERLDKNHYVAAGGEGTVYRKGGKIFKIYLDAAKVIPEKKIQELAALTDPRIIKPQALVYDGRRHAIGYTMVPVDSAVSLCQLFTRAYRDRVGFTQPHATELVQNLRGGIQSCHDAGVLIVDVNEMNFLVESQRHHDVFFIDVDSYQTKSFPATAIMDSIRDRHAKQWTRETDWFSFAVLSFQLWIGIHPYKGRHPGIQGLDARMTANVSVLNRDVACPKVCYPFSVIPKNYYDWFVAVLEKGQRVEPPVAGQGVVIAVTATTKSSRHFNVEVFLRFDHDVADYESIVGMNLTTTEQELVAETPNGTYRMARPIVHAWGVIDKIHHPVVATIPGRKLVIRDLVTGQDLDVNVEAERVFGIDGRLYYKVGDSIQEIQMITTSGRTVVGFRPVCNVMPLATQCLDGVVIQDILGVPFASFFPAAGHHYQAKLMELQGYKIVAARHRAGVLVVAAAKKGRYSRFIYRFDAKYETRDCREIHDVDHAGIEFAVARGIVALVNHSGETEVFATTIGDARVKLVQDDALEDKRLFTRGDQILAGHERLLYKVSMV